MKKFLILVALLVLVMCITAAAQPRTAAVNGFVVDRQQRPVPGLSIVLVSQKWRSTPVTTNKSGRFVFTNITSGQGYFIEVYWGRDLMYRQPVTVKADTDLGVIRL
jgi:hypothetical protein